MPGRNLNLLSLDGGGVRGLSSLYILQRIMVSIDPDNPPKPCDYFDIIGGTSTGGLIAIMLGRLRMSVDECIKAYTDLSEDVFNKKRRLPMGVKGHLKERYDSGALELAVKKILKERNLDEDALLKDPGRTKVFVCCTSAETSESILLRSWHTPRGNPNLYTTVRIWEAARATSAASTFFDPISIGETKKVFLDGGTGANNPVRHIWDEAADFLPRNETLLDNLGCLISIGTGQPGYKPFESTALGIGKALLAIATETEVTANQFHRAQSRLFETKICFRFNVPRGLGDMGLAETEQLAAIDAMTDAYLQTESVQNDLRSCVESLGERQTQQTYIQSPNKTSLELEQVKQNEDHDFHVLSRDTRWQMTNSEDESRDLLDRISTYQPQRVHDKISMQKTKSTTLWIEGDILTWVYDSPKEYKDYQNCLWISGIVGCGKTFLANTAIQTLLDLEEQNPVAHFYFDFNEHDSLMTEALLRSYIKQFLRHLYRTQGKLPVLIAIAIKRIFGVRTRRTSCRQLAQEILKPLLQKFKRPFFVVDGLDLCSAQEYNVAIDCFADLLRTTSVRIIIFGRDELNVTSRLPTSVRLEITRAKTMGDLALFTEQYIERCNTRAGPISNEESTIARIKNTLTDQAEGMFLWVRLQIDVLWEMCTTDDQINLALSKLPKGLEETYARCLQRVEGKQQGYSLRVLRYVYEAKPPLTIEALGETLATDADTGELSIDRIPVYTAVLRSAANLVIFDEVERLVIPAHHSVRQFLHRSKVPILEELDSLELDDAILNLGDMCIAHLLWHTSDADATKIVPGGNSSTDQSRLSSVGKLRRWTINSRFSKWKESTPSAIRGKQNLVGSTSRTTRNSAPRVYRPFHDYARSNWISLNRNLMTTSMTWLKFERLILLDLEDSQNEYKCDDLEMFPWKSDSSTPLSSKILGWAICTGHMPLLELGMRLQEDLTLPLDDYNGLLPLHLAAQLGNIDVFARLYTRDTAWFLDARSKNGRTALHYAAEQGHSEIIGLLLGTNEISNLTAVEERDRESQTPLYLAVSSGSLATIQTIESRCGSVLWEHDRTDSLLHALYAGGAVPEIVSYVMGRMDEVSNISQDARILKWVVQNNAVGLVPRLVNAGISLDTELDATPSDQVDKRTLQTTRPALLYTLEAPTPALAFAFLENGASREVYDRSGDLRIYPIDLALSHGWTDLASALCPNLLTYKTHKQLEITVQVTGTKVRWLSLLMEAWIITGVICESHVPCKFASQVVGHTHPRFLYAECQNDGSTHLLRLSLACPEPEPTELKFRVMMEKTKPPYNLRVRSTKPVVLGIQAQSLGLDFTNLPFSMQQVYMHAGRFHASADRIVKHSNRLSRLASLYRRGAASMRELELVIDTLRPPNDRATEPATRSAQ